MNDYQNKFVNLFSPLESWTNQRIVSFKVHHDRAFIITTDTVLAKGDNINGELGLGHQQSLATFEEIVELRGQRVKEITCGKGHNVALTELGAVWFWGVIHILSEPEQNDMRVEKPWLMFPSGNIKAISSGAEHSIALDANNFVWVWGDNSFGQFGYFYEQHLRGPVMVLGLCNLKIVNIECGAYHSIVLTDDGYLFGWGTGETIGSTFSNFYQFDAKYLQSTRDIIKEPQADVKLIDLDDSSDQYKLEESLDSTNNVISKHHLPVHLFDLEETSNFPGLEEPLQPTNCVVQDTQNEVKLIDFNESSNSSEFQESLQPTNRVAEDTQNEVELIDFDESSDSSELQEFLQLKKNVVKEIKLNSYLINPEDQPDLQKFEESLVSPIFPGERIKMRAPLILPRTLRVKLYELFGSMESSDFTFDFPLDDRIIPAHRIVLMSASHYLRNKLTSVWSDNDTISIETFSYKTFYEYIRFLYQNVVLCDTIGLWLDLCCLAKMYGEVKLRKYCIKSILEQHLNIANSCQLYQWAVKNSFHDLGDPVTVFIVRNYKSVSQSSGFQNLDKVLHQQLSFKLDKKVSSLCCHQ